jgi:hypothetical protein
MRTFLNKHPVESVYGKLKGGEFSFPLVDLVSTYGNTSKVDLKIDTFMSLPSIEKENYGNRVHNHHSESERQFCLHRFNKFLKGKKILLGPRVARIMAKEIAVEGSRTSFKLLVSLYLPLASKYLEERTIRKASLLACESVFIGLFATRPGGALSDCPFSRIAREENYNGRFTMEDG